MEFVVNLGMHITIDLGTHSTLNDVSFHRGGKRLAGSGMPIRFVGDTFRFVRSNCSNDVLLMLNANNYLVL